jgi:hypothetical protein
MMLGLWGLLFFILCSANAQQVKVITSPGIEEVWDIKFFDGEFYTYSYKEFSFIQGHWVYESLNFDFADASGIKSFLDNQFFDGLGNWNENGNFYSGYINNSFDNYDAMTKVDGAHGMTVEVKVPYDSGYNVSYYPEFDEQQNVFYVLRKFELINGTLAFDSAKVGLAKLSEDFTQVEIITVDGPGSCRRRGTIAIADVGYYWVFPE